MLYFRLACSGIVGSPLAGCFVNAVNTSMYDKGEKEDLSEFKQTEYWEGVQNFQRWIVNEARTNGLPPERLGEAVHVALSTSKPKARYAVIPQRFKNWTLLTLLPVRMFDNFIAKQMKLTKPKAASNDGFSTPATSQR